MSKVFGGRYEVIERIGAGGMGIVYKAKDLLLNRIVTVKVLREQFLSDEEFVRRFRREAQAAASLSHPNIVSIYDVGKDGEIEYIVMEYVEGRNLKEVIQEYAPLSPEQTVNLAAQIGEAIRHAHQHHIIHRDIKPHNVLVTSDGRAKVTDFGIARAVSSATVTHAGDIVGSVHYLSPEQAKGLQSNERSDLYSLGIILYELLTGRVPYDGETPISIALKHLQEEPVAPSRLNPKVSKDLENVIMRAIAKSPDQRYASAKELLDDLSKIRSGHPVVWGGEAFDLDATQIHKPLRPLNPEQPSRTSEGTGSSSVKDRAKKRRWPWIAVVLVLLLLLGGWWWLKSYLTVGMTVVPDLTGNTVPVASILLEKAKLNWGSNNTSEFSDKVENYKIISQTPDPHSKVRIGREVTVVVSKGPQMLTFPNLKEPPLSKENALNAIQNSGFSVDKVTVDTAPSVTVPAGSVIDQNPAASALWVKNGDIHLTISSGPQFQTILMPDVVGKSTQEARDILEHQNKLKIVWVNSQDSMTYPKDMVISTSPKANESVQQGAQVTITVSRGPGPVAKQLDKLILLGNLLRVVPNDGKDHDVSININDYRGWTEVWSSPYRVGTTQGVPGNVSYYPPATVQIVVDGTIQYENRFT
ncbi:MAG: Stk1 family PASTA domain-containing Ser/Thr kinase [Desulfitobacteriaceae bacterium]